MKDNSKDKEKENTKSDKIDIGDAIDKWNANADKNRNEQIKLLRENKPEKLMAEIF